MRTAITIGIHHGGEITELLAGVETSYSAQRKEFKALRMAGTHERFASIELWDSSSGRVARHKFKPSPQTPIPPPPPPHPAPPEAAPEAKNEQKPGKEKASSPAPTKQAEPPPDASNEEDFDEASEFDIQPLQPPKKKPRRK